MRVSRFGSARSAAWSRPQACRAHAGWVRDLPASSPKYRRGVRDCLDDDRVLPLVFERMATRDPELTKQVFRKLLGHNHFDWLIDGEKLMRGRKPDYFDQPRLPRIVPISDKLVRYAASA